MDANKPPVASSGLGRRDFLKAGAAAMLVVIPLRTASGGQASYDPAGHWWGFLVDLTRCMGCGACVRTCKAENAVPNGFYRTWVERYTILRDGRVEVDSPDGAINGFKEDPQVDPTQVEKSFFVPKLCNHCATSPCVQVCPVGASYISPDGVLLVDRKHCVGCGYCIQACPYGSRFLHPEGYADKCTLCYHRLTKGMATGCVQACPVGARVVGNLHDPDSPLRKLLGENRYAVLKSELGTHPKCFYFGLDQEVL
jgi:Fe-S-cluster-containing dehydrogenase component